MTVSADGNYGYVTTNAPEVLEFGITNGTFRPLAESSIATSYFPSSLSLTY